jgi:hypothetical protein
MWKSYENDAICNVIKVEHENHIKDEGLNKIQITKCNHIENGN